MSVTVLPTYQGYTIDARLQEFCKAVFGQALEFIPFNSPKGQQLLDQMAKDAPELLNRIDRVGN